MQSSSLLLCASNCLFPSASFSTSPRFPLPLSPNRWFGLVVDFSCISRGIKPESLQFQRSVLTPVNITAAQEILETSSEEAGFVEIGHICSVHGLQGEVRVKPNTDFPELRFSEPGKRWLRQQILGREIVREIELLEGRGHPGQKGWIVKFNEIDTPDQAQLLIGSTILVSEEDKPELEEDEFYSKDLVGMKVILKDTGEPVGTVVNVFNSGASDLLQVMLIPSTAGGPEEDPSASGPLVWIPFVEAIVPTVDMSRRKMLITPPKGLLELNIRSDERSKKERRQLEWKEKKKFRQRLIAAKKKLSELEQQHVFHGFRFGEKSLGSLLADQIVGVNSKLLQRALQNIQIPSNRWDLREFIEANLAKDVKSRLRIPGEYLSNSGTLKIQKESSKLQDKGRLLTSEGKVAMILFVDCKREGNIFASYPIDHAEVSCLLEAFFNDNGRYPQMEDRASVPLILVCPAHAIDSIQDTFATYNHFSFDKTKVWFLEEEKLPVVSNCPEEQNKHKILMKSPWEILQTPVGSGGLTSLLSSNGILENLSSSGVEYIEVSSTNSKYIGGYTLLGLASCGGADIGVQISDANDLEDKFDIVFSMKFISYLIKHTDQLHFQAIPKKHPHIIKVDKEWVDIVPSSPNSYELSCSIYSYLKACSPDNVCVMEVIH